MDLVAKMLRLEKIEHQTIPHPSHSEPPQERIPSDVYEYLRAKNEWDIKLYEYSKTISVLKCPPKESPVPVEAPSEVVVPQPTEAPTYLDHETNPPTNMTPPPTTFDFDTNPPADP